jgi:hypothetical protein
MKSPIVTSSDIVDLFPSIPIKMRGNPETKVALNPKRKSGRWGLIKGIPSNPIKTNVRPRNPTIEEWGILTIKWRAVITRVINEPSKRPRHPAQRFLPLNVNSCPRN